jgi:CheY-like chemotaxis protein
LHVWLAQSARSRVETWSKWIGFQEDEASSCSQRIILGDGFSSENIHLSGQQLTDGIFKPSVTNDIIFCTNLKESEKMQEKKQVKPKVLVADDERVIADTLAIILNQSGFEATAVYSGEKAVEAAEAIRPDMLISDVIMTDLNGIDAAIKIRAMLPSCKILLFSGQAATADLLDRARNQGHEFEILAKPVHPQDLLAKLRS